MRIFLPLLFLGITSAYSADTKTQLRRLSEIRPVFEQNAGQSAPDTLFSARDARGTLEITTSGARAVLVRRDRDGNVSSDSVALLFPGANWKIVEGLDKQSSTTNLIQGNRPDKWISGVPHFGAVRVKQAYPGIDIVFHSRNGLVEFDFEVAPGADPARARFSFPGRKAELLADGSLRVKTAAGDLSVPRPVAWTEDGRSVESRFHLRGASEARVRLGTYDKSKRLTIDPALSYLTYWGGSGSETPAAMAVDSAGNIYLAGSTGSTGFPVSSNAYQRTSGGNLDAFVSKFSPAGVLIYSTLIGGRDRDFINGIGVDSQGSVYFCGATASTNFPLATPIQETNKGGSTGLDAMFGKLNPAGTALVYSTYYGGNFTDQARGCTVDADGHLYVAGYTVSDNFPFTPGSFQTSNRSPIGGNGFVVKVAPAGDKAVFSTYLGGSIDDDLYGIALDRNRNIYVVGGSVSANYPTVGAYQPTNRGNVDAVLTKLSAAGTGILFSTFIGSSMQDIAFGVEVDGNDNVFVVGVTASPQFPTTPNAIKKELQGPTDMFLMKFDASGATVQSSTLFGGNRSEEPFRVAVDRSGSLYVVGTTGSSGITPVDAVQPESGGGNDAFLLKVNPAMDAVQMFTYLGGSSDDLGLAMALDGSGRVMVAGLAISTNLATTPNAAQRSSGGGADGFLAIIDNSPAATPFTVSTTRLTFSGAPGASVPRQQFNIRAATGTPEWTIDATTLRGGAWLTATPARGSGNATIDVGVNTTGLAAGTYEGTLAVNNTRLGTRTIVAVILNVASAGGTVPDNGVVSAATFAGGGVAPGLLVTVFGSGIGPAALTTAQVTPDGKLSSTVADTRVLFDDVAAPLVYASAGQVSAIVPYAVAGKATTMMQVEYRGVKSNPVSLRVVETAPGLFTANSSGKGPGAILNEDSSVNTESTPAKPGSIVVLYGTGEGITDPAGQDGLLATSVYPKPRQPVTVRIGGKETEVLYAGAAPGLVAGVFQINVRIPADLEAGAHPVVVQIGAASSPADVTVAVRP